MKGEGAWKDIFSDLYTRGLWEFRHPPEIFFLKEISAYLSYFKKRISVIFISGCFDK